MIKGMMILSKERADAMRTWDRTSQKLARMTRLSRGTVVSKVKGGLSVDIGVRAFFARFAGLMSGHRAIWTSMSAIPTNLKSLN